MRLTKLLSVLLLVMALLTGVGLRVVRLGSVPPGFDQDEACNGYDAYSILKTGRDQHGNFLPFAFQAFNDYRTTPLFEYSLVPVIGIFGLSPSVVRLGAAIWGSVDLFAIALLGGLMLGWPGAAAGAFICALLPWHLEISRDGMAQITGSATVSLAMVSFFLWLDRRTSRWLLISGAFFGLSLYSYMIAKAFTPLMIGLLGLLYRRELRQVSRIALLALGIVVLLATPLAVQTLHDYDRMQAEFSVLSLFHYMANCPDCEGGPSSASLPARLANFGANWISHFTPSFLFLTGDRGNRAFLPHPPGFGELLPEQALLLMLALGAFVGTRRRKLVVLLVGWLALAALPAALTVPYGALTPEPQDLPTPFVLGRHTLHNVPLTPRLLLSHPFAMHDLMAMAPWVLLSALGLVVMLELTARIPAVQMAAVTLLLAGATFHAARFVRAYFVDYPVIAAPYFQYGMEQVVREIRELDDGTKPVVITRKVNQPYIYVLFFGPYPPASFQRQQVLSRGGLFAPVLFFDHYYFVDPQKAYERLEHGVFVFSGTETLPAPPIWHVPYPDGMVAYSIVVK